MSDQKPTKQFLLDQIKDLERVIAMNQGALNLCKGMLEKGIFVEEEQKEGTL
jgi:hypothetical protein